MSVGPRASAHLQKMMVSIPTQPAEELPSNSASTETTSETVNLLILNLEELIKFLKKNIIIKEEIYIIKTCL